jgi:hypothetical protein
LVNEASTWKFRSRDGYNTFRLQCSNSSPQRSNSNRHRPSAQIADVAQATELPSLVDHDQAIDAPHRYDVGVEVERLAELIISPLTSSPLGVRDARVRLDSSAARVRS